MPNYNKLIPSLLEHGLEALPRYCHLTPGKFDQITTSCAALKTSKEEPECASRKSGVAQPSIWPGFDSGLAIFSLVAPVYLSIVHEFTNRCTICMIAGYLYLNRKHCYFQRVNFTLVLE